VNDDYWIFKTALTAHQHRETLFILVIEKAPNHYRQQSTEVARHHPSENKEQCRPHSPEYI